jgi:signal peptidase II
LLKHRVEFSIEVNVKKYVSMYMKLLGIAGIVVALDQWTKWLVRENIPFASQWLPEGLEWLMPYARLVYWHNTGAAFGMFQDGALVFTVLAFVVIGAILFYYPQIESEGWMFQLALSLQLAGATGNLIDRLLHDGKVTDFISIGTFPVFNVADSAITIGTAVLILGVWLSERAEKQAQAESEAGGNSGGEQIALSEE